MSLPLSTVSAPRLLSVPTRWLIFGGAAGVGVLGAFGWSLDLSDWLYNSFLGTFVNPGARVEAMAAGVGLAFLVGFAHVFRI